MNMGPSIGGIGTVRVYASKGRKEMPDGKVYVDGAVEQLSRKGSFLGQHIHVPKQGVAVHITPSYMLSILDEYKTQGRDPRESCLEVGIFGAEPWTNAMRKEVENSFDMHAVDIYGLSEVMGPGVANECVETKDGLHIWEDHFYPEIIDLKSNKPKIDGEIGELVFTTLTKEGMPIIRYRTRDLTRLLPEMRTKKCTVIGNFTPKNQFILC